MIIKMPKLIIVSTGPGRYADNGKAVYRTIAKSVRRVRPGKPKDVVRFIARRAFAKARRRYIKRGNKFY
jgi:hypothetical protein